MIESVPASEEETLFSKYLSENGSLIVDPMRGSRQRLVSTMIHLGSSKDATGECGTFEEAEKRLQSDRPRVILADYQLGSKSGLELLQQQRLLSKDDFSSIFVLITDNTAQSAVAKAAEEDVDSYIIKPMSVGALKKTLVSAAMSKLFPSEYARAVRDGKQAMVTGDLDGAIKNFQRARTLDQSPALACFYLAEVEKMRHKLESAADQYREGLHINKIHYKCLAGLFQMFLEKRDFIEAYDLAKRLVKYYPANQRRLAEVLRLAVATASFSDIEGYFHTFSRISEKNDELRRYMCSALLVTGKHYLKTGVLSRALELFEHALDTGGRNPMHIDYIAGELRVNKQGTLAEILVEKGAFH